MRPELPRVLPLEQSATYGVTPNHVRTYLRRGLWSRLTRAVVLTTGGPPTRADWTMVGLILGGPTAAVSGLDALRLAGVRAAAFAELPPLVLTRQVDVRTLGKLRLRRTERPYQVWTTSVLADPLPFVPVVHAARALSDVAGLGASPSALRALTTDAVQRRLCSPDELVGQLRAGPRRNSSALRQAIEDVVDGARSIAEARAVDLLSGARVPPFELNVPVLHRGRVIAVVDLLWRELRAVVEIDSRRHHASGADWDRTLVRHNRLTALGLAVRHDAPSRLGAGWADEVATWLRRRAGELDVPYRAASWVVRPGAGSPPPFDLP